MKNFVILFVILFVGCLIYLGNFMKMTPYQETKARFDTTYPTWTKLEDVVAGTVLYSNGAEMYWIKDNGPNKAPIIEDKIVMEDVNYE